MQSAFGWMAWTLPVAIFFVAVGVLLVGMTVWELKSPTVARKGWLPLATTRGDRLFIGLLGAAYLNLIWAGVTDLHQGFGAALGFLLVLLTMRWG